MDTIYACATPLVKSGVAVIRVSGDASKKIAAALTRKKTPFIPRKCYYLPLYSANDDLLDRAIVVVFESPASFTGEDIVEFHIHGGRAVIANVLDAIARLTWARLAEAGEFSKRAFINGKMDLLQAEGLSDLIEAETQLQAKQALRHMQGHASDVYENWRKILIQVLAKLEAYIDFPDEEIPSSVTNETLSEITQLKDSISHYLEQGNFAERIRSGAYVTIIGAPNVGKSSFINALARRDIAIVSEHAGTTRDVIELHLDLNGYPVIIADTAGIREHKDDIEEEGIKRAIERAASSDLNIAMFDITNLPALDKKTQSLIDTSSIVVFNKKDMAPDLDYPDEVNGAKTYSISLNTMDGLDAVLQTIENHVSNLLSADVDPIITRQRHRNLLTQALRHIQNFSLEKDIELASEDIRITANLIGQITGHIGVEDILDNLFSNFCIGK